MCINYPRLRNNLSKYHTWIFWREEEFTHTNVLNAEAKKLWEPILQNLKSQASKPFYEEYLQPITPRSWDGTTLTLTVTDPGLAEIIQARVGIQATRYLAALSENSDASIIITSPHNHTLGGYQHAER